MRQSCAAALVFSIALLIAGCQQTPNASTQLTPVGTMSQPQLAPVGTVAPVSGTSGIGPFGRPTRIPPPSTGSYGVPNNYMGGTTTIGEVGINTQPIDQFRSSSGVQAAGFADAPATGGVATTSFGSGFQTQGAPAASTPPSMQPQLGGMRVHDLTGAPLPPGYRGNAVVIPSQPQQPTQPRSFAPNPAGGYPAGGYPGGGNTGGRFHQSPPANSAPPAQVPTSLPGAVIATQPIQSPVSIAQRPGAGISNEVPLQSSPLQPSFNGASRFNSGTPSTDPVGSGAGNQQENLPWRRPGTSL